MAIDFDRLRLALADRYTFERELGQGGMATVYLALDIRHDRRVAVKVLKPELAALVGSARFLREITVTAGLQHPHILALFDSGEADGFLFYVMPYVEGESLRHKLDREKQLPVDEAVGIATSVAGALDYAHRHRVVHRDIKPENILLHDGQALVADFGIALAVSDAGGSRLTQTGISLGTPHYMSPEQALGDQEIDARSDVYSLGAVLYEMLTGEPPATGPSAQAILAHIITDQPRPVARHRPSVPPNVAASVDKALAKLPADRFSTAAQFADALADPSFGPSVVGVDTAGRARGTTLRRVAWPAAALVGLGLGAFSLLRDRGEHAPVVRQTIRLRSVGEAPGSVLLGTAIAPDGSAIAFVDSVGSRSQIWIKERGALDAAPLPGTAGASGGVTFSPDGEWIAYEAGRQIVKLHRRGGVPVILSDSAGGGLRPAWLDDGTIVFPGEQGGALYRVSSDGGTTTRLLSRDDLDRVFVFASPFPGARAVLVTVSTPSFDDSELMVLDLVGGEVTTLVTGAGWGAYAPTGQLVYTLRDGTLWAASIDRNDFTLAPAVQLDVGIRTVVGLAEITLGDDGTLLYVRGQEALGKGLLVTVDRAGNATALDPAFSLPHFPINGSLSLSPDGSLLAMTLPGEGSESRNLTDDIYVKRLPTGPATRITYEGTSNRRPSWSPDGTRLAFISNRGNQGDNVWSKRADGSGNATLVADEERQIFEVEWSRDGRWLVYRTDDEGGIGRGDILGLGTDGDAIPTPLVATDAEETSPSISGDSQWLAYASDETGRKEVYVRPFPNTGEGKWIVSTGGGTEPAWSSSGRELFYRDDAGNMVAASISTAGNRFEIVDRQVLFDANRYLPDDDHRFYEVVGDGEQFIMIDAGATGAPGDVIQVSNFHQVLRDAERRGRL